MYTHDSGDAVREEVRFNHAGRVVHYSGKRRLKFSWQTDSVSGRPSDSFRWLFLP